MYFRALTKYYVVSVLVVMTMSFPDQGKQNFVLTPVIIIPYRVTKFTNVWYMFYVYLFAQENEQKFHFQTQIKI